VAAIALRAKVTVMNVVSIMATTARLGCFNFISHWTVVTFIAVGNISMRPRQFKTGLVVIKIP
jgi:hypothetical protein